MHEAAGLSTHTHTSHTRILPQGSSTDSRSSSHFSVYSNSIVTMSTEQQGYSGKGAACSTDSTRQQPASGLFKIASIAGLCRPTWPPKRRGLLPPRSASCRSRYVDETMYMIYMCIPQVHLCGRVASPPMFVRGGCGAVLEPRAARAPCVHV